ncbi:MAG: DNA primase DnaG [Candidatus Nanoarchaeia archaeon]|nr:DNA primase DnaG [Candidatus Nanoarchaeia archaeon]MDD5239341.1 DNA primase DnaG [Candidatus Nanoarchaeia archaeon]
MGKISPVSAKYIIHVDINADGTVDKPDVIGAIFGQTEGLLGAELELRELQKNGRIGRIEVNIDTKGGKAGGVITIPSSLDMAETAIIAGAVETIQRIGPCNAKLKVRHIEDVRVSKREYVVDRAKELLREMIAKGPESTEIMEEIKSTVRALEIVEYGPEKLPAGPGINESDELIVVEGRADVIALLKNGFKNVIGINGTSVPPSVAELTRQKTSTIFTDGDRGGLLIIKEIAAVGEVDFAIQAPDGKEVEELTQKEINKALRARMPLDQFLQEHGLEAQSTEGKGQSKPTSAPSYQAAPQAQPQRAEPVQHEQREQPRYEQREQRYDRRPDRRFGDRRFDRRDDRRDSGYGRDMRGPMPTERYESKPKLSPEIAEQFKKMLDELIGTRGAYLLDEPMNILGKVPVSELGTTIQNLPEVSIIIMDGAVTPDIVTIFEATNIQQVVAMEVNATSRKFRTFSAADLGA